MGDRSTPSGGSGAQGYTAFISYSHAVDGRLAPALQAALHRFAKPWYRLRALRVFRDQASLSANPALWGSIASALAGSEFFILLASPDAARSPWVQREVAYWCGHKPTDRLLIVVTDGEAVWDDAAGDFDWDRTTALPRSLAGVFDEEPRYIDLRWARTEEHLSLAHPRFRDAVADLAAPLHQRPKDELVGEDVRQHRRTVRLARSAIASLTVLTVLAVGAAVLYAGQRNFARSETVRARRQTDLATSRLFAAEADARATSQPILSSLLSVAAYRAADTVEARGSLLRQVERRRGVQAILAGHSGGIRTVAFSHDGQTLASGSIDKTVVLWDAHRHTRLATLAGHADTVLQVAFSPDDRTLASGSVDKTIILWDVATRTRLTTLRDHSDWVTSVAFHPDGRTLAAGLRDASVVFWDIPRRSRHGPPLSLRRVAGVGAVEFPQVAYSPDGRMLAVGAGAVIVILGVGRDAHMRVLPGETQAPGLAFSPDGRTLVSAGSVNNSAVMRNVVGDTTVRTLIGHADQVMSVAVSPNGGTAASTGLDRTVVLWNVARRDRLGPNSNGTADIVGMAFGPDGRTLVSADASAVLLWDVAGGARVGILSVEGEGMGTFALSPDGQTLASVGAGDISLWDIERRARLGTLEGHSRPVLRLAFSPGSQMLASAGADGTVILWDVAARNRLLTLEGQPGGVLTVAFSPDGSMLAAGGFDETVMLWDLAAGTQVATLRGHPTFVNDVAFSPDGKLLAATSSRHLIALWDVRRRTRVASLDAAAHSVVFSPDHRTLATADQRAVIVWDVERRTQLARLDDVAGYVAFSPDGRTLAAAGRDHAVILRDFDVGAWQRHLCGIVGRDLSEAEWRDFVPSNPTGGRAAERPVSGGTGGAYAQRGRIDRRSRRRTDMTETIGGPPAIFLSAEEFAWLRQQIGDFTTIIERALDQEDRGEQVDLGALWTDIKQALLPDEVAEAAGPAAASHPGTPVLMAAHSARTHKTNWKCWTKGPGRGARSKCHTVKAATDLAAWQACRDFADTHDREPDPGVPKQGRCP